jgi:hypothetical protein
VGRHHVVVAHRVEQLARLLFDDRDDVIDELEGGRRHDAWLARRHDGAGVAGEHDAGARPEHMEPDGLWSLLRPIHWLRVGLSLVANCDGGPPE